MMRSAINGWRLSPDEQAVIAAAHREDPKRYAREHAEVKEEEVARLRSFGRSG